MDIAYVRVSAFKDVASPPALPLDITNIVLSKPNANGTANLSVRPGDKVTITATLAVGPQDLGFSTQTYFSIKAPDPNAYNGMGSDVATLPVVAPALGANQTVTVSTVYTVPAGLTAGVYSVGLQANYTSSTINGDGVNAPRGINNPQLALITVTP